MDFDTYRRSGESATYLPHVWQTDSNQMGLNGEKLGKYTREVTEREKNYGQQTALQSLGLNVANASDIVRGYLLQIS